MAKAGENLGRYELLEELGRGAAGAVFKARDTMLNDIVCIKVLIEGLAGDEKVLERFKRELLIARKITHAGVCKSFDIQTHDDDVFLVMEFVEGEDLTSLLSRRGPLPVKEAVQILRGACQALGAAHQVGVVHRDLKPGNILVRPDGRISVVDFGIATAEDMEGLTRPGMVLGSRKYVAPERWTGGAADARTDIWSLGIILYACVTAKLPYQGDGLFGVLDAVKNTTPTPPSEINPEVPRLLEDVIAKALSVEPEGRYADGNEMDEALSVLDMGEWTPPLAPSAPALPDEPPAERTVADASLPFPDPVTPPTLETQEAILLPSQEGPETLTGEVPAEVLRSLEGEGPSPPPDGDGDPANAPTVPGIKLPEEPFDGETAEGALPDESEEKGFFDAEGLPDRSREVTIPTVLVKRADSLEPPKAPPPASSNKRAAIAAGGAAFLVVALVAWALGGPEEEQPAPSAVAAADQAPDGKGADDTPGPGGDPASSAAAPDEAAAAAGPTDAGSVEEDPSWEFAAVDEPAEDDEGLDEEAADPSAAAGEEADEHEGEDETEDEQQIDGEDERSRKVASSSRKRRTERSRRQAARQRAATRGAERRRYLAEKSGVQKAMSRAGLRPGDDDELDRLRRQARSAARKKRYEAAARLAEEARKRAAAVPIDKALVSAKLQRLNRAYDALQDAEQKKKVAEAMRRASRPFAKGDWAEANRALNAAFRLLR